MTQKAIDNTVAAVADARKVYDYLAKTIRDINTANGWREPGLSKGDRIALIHSEVSELLEWVRKPGESDHIPASGEAEELADIIIRVIDYADLYGEDLAGALMAKLEFNRGRGYRHGGKKL